MQGIHGPYKPPPRDWWADAIKVGLVIFVAIVIFGVVMFIKQ